MKKNRKLFVICFLSLILILLCGCTKSLVKTEKPIEQVETKLNKESNENSEEIRKHEEQNYMEADSSKIQDISKYPYIVQGNGEIDIKIFSSANYAKERWLVDVINKFNQQKNLVDGKSISISLKCIPSELMLESILMGEGTPDAIIPENEFLPEMLKAKNIQFNQETEILFKNPLGFIVDESIYNLLESYGEVDFYAMEQAALEDKIKIGLVDDDWNLLNLIVSSLYSFDNKDILSSEAIEQFQNFTANIEFSEIIYMSDAIREQRINAIILDYNIYVNTPELNDYLFIPFGVANNNPLYSNSNISKEKQRAIKLFSYYATTIKAKKLAKQYGAIICGNYVSGIPYINGETLLEIKELLEDKI